MRVLGLPPAVPKKSVLEKRLEQMELEKVQAEENAMRLARAQECSQEYSQEYPQEDTGQTGAFTGVLTEILTELLTGATPGVPTGGFTGGLTSNPLYLHGF